MQNNGKCEKKNKNKSCKNAKDFIRYTSRPTCANWKALENSLVAIHEKKLSLTLNKLNNHMYQFIPLQRDYLCETSLKSKCGD